MAGLLDRLRADLGMAPAANPANPAKVSAAFAADSQIRRIRNALASLPDSHDRPRFADSRESHGAHVLEPDLERRIRAMAARWQYTADDLAYALQDAGRRPDAWLACCAWDEALTAKCERAGLSWPLGVQ